MPLLPIDTEFADKWIGVCEAYLCEDTPLNPISCYEYLGNFYVQEGNKRVSVLKSMDAPTIAGHVIRLIPAWSQDPAVQIYYEFLRAYELSGLYQVFFTQSCSFWKLQEALGHRYSQVWTEDDRRRFVAGLLFFQEAYEKLGGGRLSLTVTDALLIWLRRHSFGDLKTLSLRELVNSLRLVWLQIQMTDLRNRVLKGTVSAKEMQKWTIGRRQPACVDSADKE